MLSAEDRWAIAETLSLHGHLFDQGQLDRLEELFTPDVVYDVTDVGMGMGMGMFVGIDEIRRAGLELGVGNPIAHHVTNVVITGDDGDEATAQSKGLAVMADGRCVSATYLDTLRRTDHGWRLRHRVILARRTPLNGAYLANAYLADPDSDAPEPQ
ncbi:Polyketide cyclase [Frankia canadensis]|uniref:Polyketide cyclase n=1 Tax=Frankia canadensis TaxID=1836972 RepID=A0A2I2KZ23_9ACTN|nr:nuclear transport factor 2 family protein [Frankia canadensis]SNQ50908.1 Polyketide cyclase [Frankia canadensis]SOU58198.1 Polyketide cyclase [Frankia canadensis]